MPIRFRCAYCNQLMGIARRKAGTVIRCPNCAGQVIVPNPEPGAEEPPGHLAPQPAAPQPSLQENAPLFEGSDFDTLFGGGVTGTGGFEPRPFPIPTPPPSTVPPRPLPLTAAAID